MNKQELLSKYEKEEDRLIISKLLDKIDFVEKKNRIEYTDFLDIHQKALIEKVLKEISYTNYKVYGGYENAERTVVILYPEKLETVFGNSQFDYDTIMKIIRITLPNEMRGKYTHRDYLGAIIKVGVKREKVGDIITYIDGADVIVSKEMLTYLMTSLGELTRFHKSKLEETKMQDIRIEPPRVENLQIIIPSMRADSIVSELIRTSRSKVIEIINAERVFVNSELITKNSKMLKEEDNITVRGKGRFKIKRIVNSTKKGNLVLEVEKYM